MVELRKRKEPATPAIPPPLTKRASSSSVRGRKAAGTSSSAADAVANSAAVRDAEMADVSNDGGEAANSSHAAGKVDLGSFIDLGTDSSFGGEVETHDGDGKKVTLAQLLEDSGAGVVVFTYPKASTPGCTTQGCLFRDNYLPISGAGLSVFGLSMDSPKSKTTFATKHSFPYPLLCDPKGTLIKALGLSKAGNKIQRASVVIDKTGHVRVHEKGGPQSTLDAVLEYVKSGGVMNLGAPAAVGALPAEDPKATEAAAKLAEPAHVGLPEGEGNVKELDMDGVEKMDEVPLIKEASKEEKQAADTAAEVAEVAMKVDAPA